MPKTNVDDLLIEMIAPKVKEIEERFSRGDNGIHFTTFKEFIKNQQGRNL